MPIALDRAIRKTLERVVRDARVAAEKGALNALHELGVADAKRPAWLSPAQGELRNRLRAHARALGDRLNSDDTMRLSRLVREIAYAHWHRALFARFLLENGLLVDVEAGNAPVSATDIRAIAEEENREFAEVAAEFAQPMLPEIFRNDDPVLALALPPEARQEIAHLVDGLPAQTFKADDALGWTYQFWQSDRKKQVNKSEAKIGADELPAVTQLFTEDYMVLFLLENTLGAWWAGKKLADSPGLARDAADEDELRRRLSPDGYEWTYLRFVRDEDGDKTGPWRPAAGTFPSWPQTAREITMLDPCMGSGHFLVFALDILVTLRKAEEGLDDESAVLAVLSDNLHGLEIDPRCTQIAAFALALSAWKRIGRVRPLPALNLACSGLAIGMGRAEFVKLAERIAEADGFAGGASDMLGRERNPMEEQALARRRGGLERLYDLFAQAPVLGSLIDPRRALGDFGDILSEGFDGLSGVIGKVLDKASGNPDIREAAVTAQGLAKAAELLGRQFTLVATNVPYLGRGDQGEELRRFIDIFYPSCGPDVATAFIQRADAICRTVAVVSPWSWMFKDGYRNFRQRIAGSRKIIMSCILGSRAFETISGEEVSVTLTLIGRPSSREDFPIVDASSAETSNKNVIARTTTFDAIKFLDATAQNGYTLSKGVSNSSTLSDRSTYANGIQTSDYERMAILYWEVAQIAEMWKPLQSTTDFTKLDCGLERLIRWEGGAGDLHNFLPSVIRGQGVWGRLGIAVSATGDLKGSLYRGELFDESLVVLLPHKEEDILPLWALVSGGSYNSLVRAVDAGRKVRSGLVKIPFDLAHWQQVAAERYPNGLPKPYSSDPTQWLFDGHPRGSANPNALDEDGKPTRPGMAEHPLQVAAARLLGYRWPRQTGSSFMDCPAIDAPDEIDVSGRADADGIVCLPALAGEAGAAERLRGVLQAAWGPEWREGVVRACLQAEEAKVEDLDGWLADEFFDGHCRLFHQTPFIWHVWDGLRGGFSALVNYHKLCAPDGGGRRRLEKLRDTYLGEWIARQRRLASDGDALAEDRLAAAEHLRGELTRIIEGEPPYDIFVRWKPLSQQPIGWEPDIDDGVRLNIRPFITARPRGARGAKVCILRVRPGVKKYEGADRGGEPYREKADYPWFWAEDHDVATEDFAGGAEFKGRRYNDFHFSRRVKQAARAAKTPGSEAAE